MQKILRQHLFVDSIYRKKVEQILIANSLPKETIIMHYRNMKVKACLPDGDPDFFIVAGIFQGGIYQHHIYL